MKTVLVFVMALFMAGCSTLLGPKNVGEFKQTAPSYTSFIIEQDSVLVYRNYARRAESLRNDPVSGSFRTEKKELDRKTGNGYVTSFHDGRVQSHVEVEQVNANTTRVKAWWRLASGYTECTVRKTGDPSTECEWNEKKWPAVQRD